MITPAISFILGALALTQTGFKSTQSSEINPLIQDLPHGSSFPLISEKLPTILVDSTDDLGVVRVATDFQSDIERVCGRRPLLSTDAVPKGSDTVIIGTLTKSKYIQNLVKARKLDVKAIRGKWESYLIQVVNDPMPGVARALVIAGSDKRGAIFGAYDLSQKIGVSPWYWWADVRVPHKDALYVNPGPYIQGEPKVKYRGFFINDEAPSLSNWVHKNFGEYRHEFYTRVFELLLRLRANYLWPAMWNNSFAQDDPLNMVLADQYGIVMGTSHVEPMMRADKEWNRLGYSQNDWNYLTHPKELEAFWRDGVLRNKPYETITTIAMRGKIDTPMSETANISLLEKIVQVQRKVLAETINPDVTKIPQLWALYKEVQEYYDKGMRVPDDVTLLWCDDNWGNIRRLPTPSERNRKGGAGVYYHFDYVGGPRNYKWIDTNPLPKIWEQMNLAHQYGANKIWIVNVGDIKPMELPIEFFLTMAWDPDALTQDRIADFTLQWAERNFGNEHAAEIADIVAKTLKYNGRVKPELLSPETYSLVNYSEADRVVHDYQDLVARAERLYAELPEADRDAFFQLILHPAKSAAIVTELYVAVAKNRFYALEGRASTDDWAEKAKALFAEDNELKNEYHTIHGGKWDHMMDQTHIGYTSWQQPDQDIMPELATYHKTLHPYRIGVSIEGIVTDHPPTLPPSDRWSQPRWFEIVSFGGPLPAYRLISRQPDWLSVTKDESATFDPRYTVSINWNKAPKDSFTGQIDLVTEEGTRTIQVPISYPSGFFPLGFNGFVESDGVISIEPEHFAASFPQGEPAKPHWQKIPDYGRTLSGMTIFPVTSPSKEPGPESPHLEYSLYVNQAKEVTVRTILSPTLAFQPKPGLRFAVSFDNEKPQIVDASVKYLSPEWEESVKTSARIVQTKHHFSQPGVHILKIWMVDPGVVIQKLIVDCGGLKPSLLGPPESPHYK